MNIDIDAIWFTKKMLLLKNILKPSSNKSGKVAYSSYSSRYLRTGLLICSICILLVQEVFM